MGDMISKKGTVEDTLMEDALWNDPMCYPAYDTTSLLERNGTAGNKNKKDAAGNGSCRVAA